MAEHAQSLQLGELVAHRRGRGHDRALLHQRARADRAPRPRCRPRRRAGAALPGAGRVGLSGLMRSRWRRRRWRAGARANVSRRVPSAGSISPSEVMRASPSGSIACSSPGHRERHVEPQPEQQALARALLGGELLERARRRLARARARRCSPPAKVGWCAARARAWRRRRCRCRGSRGPSSRPGCAARAGRRGRSWPSRTSGSPPRRGARSRARRDPPGARPGAPARPRGGA